MEKVLSFLGGARIMRVRQLSFGLCFVVFIYICKGGLDDVGLEGSETR